MEETDETKLTSLNPEDAQQPGRRQLRILMDALPLLIAYLDPDERFRFTNTAHQEWFGYEPGEIAGMGVREVLGEATYGILKPYIRTALSGQHVRFEADVPHRRFGLRHICATYVPDITEAGQTRGFFTLDSDITESRHAEALQRMRLDEVTDASRLSAMGELATQIAHEVNQPLTAIASFCEAGSRIVATGDAEPAGIAEILREIATEAERAAEIIREMRRLLRKRLPQLAEVDLNELLRAVLRLARVKAGWHGVTMSLDEEPSAMRVQVDRILVEQVILNLLQNAMETMETKPREERRLIVQTRRRPEHLVEVAVQDNGAGLPVDAGNRIFDPFFTTKPNGMGMGLAISRSIVEMHGGRLWASSNPEGGATFRFTLSAGHAPDS